MYLRVPVQIRSRFEKTWLFLNMSLEKGSSLLIQEISRPITNDKKDHFGEWEGVSANPNFTNPLEKCGKPFHYQVRKMPLEKVEVAFSSLSVWALP